MRRLAKPLVTIALLVAACSRVDGAPLSEVDLNEKTCAVDRDCGVGRYCNALGQCAIDCSAAKDCAYLLSDPSGPNDLDCSPCGRCLPLGSSDERCVNPTAITCTTDAECAAAEGQGFVCTGAHVCVKSCASDDDCAALVRGYSCGGGVCQELCISDGDCVYHGWGVHCGLPTGTDQLENRESASPVQASCEAISGGVDYGDAASADGPGGAYQGVWGFLVVISVRITGIPILTQENSAGISRQLVKISHDAQGNLTLSEKLCQLQFKNFLDNDAPFKDLAPTIVPDRYSDSLPLLEHHVMAPPSLVPGAALATDTILDLRGAILPDPVHSALPTYKDLTNEWDEDRDGHPGVTVDVTGIANGDLYQTVRVQFAEELTVIDADHLGGLVSSINEQTTLGASTPDLIYDLTTETHPVADRSYARAVRMTDAATCDDVITLGQAGAWLEYDPHYDPNKKP